MSREVALKRLMLFQQSFDVRQGCRLKIFLLQHLLLTYRGQQGSGTLKADGHPIHSVTGYKQNAVLVRSCIFADVWLVRYLRSRLRGWWLFGGISQRDDRVSPVCGSRLVAILHNPFLLPLEPPKHWKYPTIIDYYRIK